MFKKGDYANPAKPQKPNSLKQMFKDRAEQELRNLDPKQNLKNQLSNPLQQQNSQLLLDQQMQQQQQQQMDMEMQMRQRFGLSGA